jgi:hypothetical protein
MFIVGQRVWVFDRRASEVPVFSSTIRLIDRDGDIFLEASRSCWRARELYTTESAAHEAAAKYYQELADRHAKRAEETRGNA